MALSKMQYESIIKEYEHIRDRNRHIGEQRKDMIYVQIPDYKQLDESVAGMSVRLARLVMDNVEGSMDEARFALRKLSLDKKKLLTNAGYPADYLDPVYDCNDCQDTGFLTDTTGVKEKCHCFRNREIAVLYDQSNIQRLLDNENFSTLSFDYYQGEDLARFKKAVKICRDFVQNFEQDYHNLFFYGTVGTGKSFLSGCVAYELIHSCHSVLYFSATQLFDTLGRYSFDTNNKEALYDFCNDLYGCDLVIIDDLGTEITNAFVSSKLFTCLNERKLRRKATIISTNLSLEELRDRYSDRVFSRITSDYELCKLTGPDIRMLKKRNANSLNS